MAEYRPVFPNLNNIEILDEATLTARVSYYKEQRTSERHPEWRNTTIWFIDQLCELAHRRPAFKMNWKRTDGVYLWANARPVVYLHFYQDHFLVHTNPDCLIWDTGDNMFQLPRHQSAWPRMWHATTRAGVSMLLEVLDTESMTAPGRAGAAIESPAIAGKQEDEMHAAIFAIEKVDAGTGWKAAPREPKLSAQMYG